jgi:hypothetical protein
MTKGGKLKDEVADRMKKYEAPEGIVTKVVENSGRSIKTVLVRNDPFPREHCGRNDCTMKNGKCKEKCYTANSNYTIKCKRCEFKVEETIKNVMNVVNENNETENERHDVTEVNDDDLNEELEAFHYAGETSRSVYFRFMLHLKLYKTKKNHM